MMKILVTNDDGIRAKGIRVLAGMMKKYGEVTVVAPSEAQSGMSMAIPLGMHQRLHASPVEVRGGIRWQHLDSTPDACVKFALDETFRGDRPDLVIAGINHGANSATAACYSATLGAAAEGAVNGIPAIGVSLDAWTENPDFSGAEAFLPGILEKLLPHCGQADRFTGLYYNINFPDLPPEEIKGVAVCNMGRVHWSDEFVPNPDGTYHLEGDITDDAGNTPDADHRKVAQGWISIVPHNIDSTDYREMENLKTLFCR